MQPQSVLRWSVHFLALPLYLAVAGCGGGSSNTPAPAPPPAPASAVSPSPGPSSVPTWSQLAETNTCSIADPSLCAGAYGFTVFPNGSYLVGPAPGGQATKGHLTATELSVLTGDAVAVLQTNISSGLTCISDAPIVGTNTTTSITPVGQSSVVIYQQSDPPNGSNCYAGSQTPAFNLHNDLNTILMKYYPVPFPAPIPPPAPGVVQNGQWGGPHVMIDVSNAGATFKFECAQGEATQPLVLDSSNDFQVAGTYTPTSGPIIPGPGGQSRPSYPAVYSGTVTGNAMTLTVQYQASDGNSQSQQYQLTYQADGVFDQLCALLPTPSPSPSSAPTPSPTPSPSASPSPTPSLEPSPSPSDTI
jgi:hypothetical protein